MLIDVDMALLSDHAVRVNISIPSRVLAVVDEAAARDSESRSGFLARAALEYITVADARIIEAPSSTKNRSGERVPEMRQTKKGSEWHFGMKVHIGADAETRTVCCTVERNGCGVMQGIRASTSVRGIGSWMWSGR